MRVLVTGSRGFIGKNIVTRLAESDEFEVLRFDRHDSPSLLPNLVENADAIIHLAGENRPKDFSDFVRVNTELTQWLCDLVSQTHRKVTFVLASSIQAERENLYGASKLGAERAVENLCLAGYATGIVFRLPNVFGKWARPNYNSVVATFCHNIANDLPIQIDSPTTPLRLVYVDDVVSQFIRLLAPQGAGFCRIDLTPEYSITLAELATQIEMFRDSRTTLLTSRVGSGLVRALYATYVSYLPPSKFSYPLPRYGDTRGDFVEMLKTPDCGQLSYFTTHPGVTRGAHYHHSKTEKFLVVQGTARFRFRNILNGDTHEIVTSSNVPQVVDTVPGWVHDITNIGHDEMVVMLWANEMFDRARPDTIANRV